MQTITRGQLVAALHTAKRIQSVTWQRRVDKAVFRCITCDAETALHRGQRFCNDCNDFVATYKSMEATEGDVVRMQFIPQINPKGTKNWTPAGGFLFNAPSKAEADRIKEKHGLFQCLKMSEQVPTDDANELARLVSAGDLPALPRVFGISDVTTYSAEGEMYQVVG